jgi:outer membrane protein assembly factor BamA
MYASAEHYIPFLNKKRVIAFRAATELSDPDGGNVVPFYMQPTLGGSDNLRGFGRYRFYDNNSLLFNAEYRWEISYGFDMALFADAGKVTPRRGQINLSSLQTDAGFGFRFKSPNKVVLRIDAGFSREGFQTWVVFNNIY